MVRKCAVVVPYDSSKGGELMRRYSYQTYGMSFFLLLGPSRAYWSHHLVLFLDDVYGTHQTFFVESRAKERCQDATGVLQLVAPPGPVLGFSVFFSISHLTDFLS